MQRKTTFISYSRRQLYFAERLALQLQNAGLTVWFDLQELTAGTVWSEGLTQGVEAADQMVLVVSQASLASPHCQAEWQTFVDLGKPLVLVIFEPVTLPDTLRGLPTYDLRRGFARKVSAVAGYLQGQAKPRLDRVPRHNPFGWPGKLAGGVWMTLLAHFVVPLACLAAVVLTSRPAGTASTVLLWTLAASLVATGWSVRRLMLRRASLRQLKRACWLSFAALIPILIAMVLMVEPGLLGVALWMTPLLAVPLVVRFWTLRRSASLLRWMPPEEDLQPLRKRLHLPLARSRPDPRPPAAGPAKDLPPLTYALHADPADRPTARQIRRAFGAQGFAELAPDAPPAHHVAILSNRSAAPWVRRLTTAHGGNIVFVVTSTIAFDDSLSETGRYQWVDARMGRPDDLTALARSLSDPDRHKRAMALEATPSKIDSWTVPRKIAGQKRLIEFVALCLLVFGLTDVIGSAFSAPEGTGDNLASAVLIGVSLGLMWLASRALIYRKMSKGGYFTALALGFMAVAWLRLLPRPLEWTGFETTIWGDIGIVTTFGLMLLLLILTHGSGQWLPARAPIHPDEVGIQHAIARQFRRRHVRVAMLWVAVILGAVLWAMTA